MKRDKQLLFRGFGIGVIVATFIFYSFITFSTPKNDFITNSEVVQKAKSLGMIFISELDAEKAIKGEIESE